MIKKIDRTFILLIVFFSTVFTTFFLGPVAMRLSPIRILLIVYGIYRVVTVLAHKKIIISQGINNNFVFLVVWVLYASLISLLVSIDIIQSINYIVYLFIALFIYLVLNDVKADEELILQCLKVFVVGVIINEAIGIYELITHNYLFTLNNDYLYLTRHNYAVTFYANPNNLCSFLAIGYIICLALVHIEKKKLLRLIYITCMIVSVIIMVLNISESNIIGVVIASLFFILYKKKIDKKITIKKLVLVLAASIFVLVNIDHIISFLVPYMGTVLNSFGVAGSTTSSRVELAKTAIANMLNHHFFGVGAGNAGYYAASIGTLANLHNWFVEILVDYGVLFFIFYLCIYVLQFITSIRYSSNADLSNNTKTIMLMFAVFLVSFLAFNISGSSLFAQEYIWIIWGIGYYISSLSENAAVNFGMKKAI